MALEAGLLWRVWLKGPEPARQAGAWACPCAGELELEDATKSESFPAVSLLTFHLSPVFTEVSSLCLVPGIPSIPLARYLRKL